MTTLKDLSPEELTIFETVIKWSLTAEASRSEVQQKLHDQTGKLFGLKMIQRYRRRLREGGTIDAPLPKPEPKEDPRESLSLKGTGSETAELNGVMAGRVVTLEDALKKGNVDLTKWDVATWEITSWEVGHKAKAKFQYNDNSQIYEYDKKMEVTPLWRVNVKLKAKMGWSPSEFKKILIDDLRKLAPSYKTPQPAEGRPPVMLEVSIFDAHFGKLGWAPETQQDYDLKICRKRYMAAGHDLLGRGADYCPERILLVFGNDFFHTDHKGLTTAGTPQDCDGRWQKAFRVGKDCTITLAEEASQIAPVDILIVQGNHDYEKIFCLGEVLDARFHNNHMINVINEPDPFSYYPWGKVMLGFCHGDKHMSDAKLKELPTQMIEDRPVESSKAVWREWHLGHIHSEKEDVWHYRKSQYVRTTAIRRLPSLSSTDAWHRGEGYASVLAAEAHVYHKEKGRRAYLLHQTEG